MMHGIRTAHRNYAALRIEGRLVGLVFWHAVFIAQIKFGNVVSP